MAPLVNLPPELLELILRWLDPNTLFLASLVCKTLRNHIFSTKSSLHYHFDRIPGFGANDDDTTKFELVRLLDSGLQDNLLRGVNILADRTYCQFLRRANPKLSLLQACPCSIDHCILVLVDALDHTIRVFTIEEDTAIFAYSLPPSLLAGYDSIDDPRNYVLNVLGVAAITKSHKINPRQRPTSKLFVLYQYSIVENSQNSFVSEAARNAREMFKLVKFDGECIIGVQDLHVQAGDRVLGMAVKSGGRVALVIKRGAVQRLLSLFFPEHWRKETGDRSRVLTTAESSLDSVLRNITDINLLNDRIYLYSSLPTPEWYTELRDGNQEVLSTRTPVLDSRPKLAQYTCGPAFATHHRCHIKELNDDREYCLNTMLAIGIRHSEPQEACIIKSVQYPNECNPIIVGSFRDDAMRYTVAKLCGFDNTLQTSVGPVLAISSDATRIAIAVWKRVWVWAISPDAFLDPNEDPTADVEAMDEAGDPEYLEFCGHWYYRMYEREGRIVSLPPVELENDMVIHKLTFAGEDLLYGLTSRGLVLWDMRAGCAGRRSVGTMDEFGEQRMETVEA